MACTSGFSCCCASCKRHVAVGRRSVQLSGRSHTTGGRPPAPCVTARRRNRSRNTALTAALLDRPLQHAHVITIKSDSYRLNDERKPGLPVCSAMTPGLS